MPAVSISDQELHIRLKIWVARRPELSIGRAAEEFIKFGLDSGLGELSQEQKQRVLEFAEKLKR